LPTLVSMRVLLIIGFLWGLSIHGQEGKLRYNGFYFEPISLHPTNNNYGGLVGFGFGASFKSSKHLFRINMVAASQYLSSQDSNPARYDEIALLYGHKHKVINLLEVDAFLGAAYFYYNDGVDKTTTSISFPLHTSFRFLVGKKFSLGFSYGLNVNQHKPLHRVGFLMHWKSKNKRPQ